MIITHLGAQGDGVAGSMFVPGTAPGDEIMLDDSGKVAGIIPGPNRAEPPCAHFGDCGGCTLQHVAVPAYAEWLSARILMALRQHDVVPGYVHAPHVSPAGARRRVALKALRTASAVILGFNRKSAYILVDIDGCAVADQRITLLFTPLRILLGDMLKPNQPATVHITWSDTGADVLIGGLDIAHAAQRQTLVAFALTHNLARLSLRTAVGVDVILEPRAPTLRLDDVDVILPVDSFTQATPQAESAMISAAQVAIGKAAMVADLFCGIGTFALPLSRLGKVHGVEASQSAVQALERAARENKRRITTEHRDLYRRPLLAMELNKFDAVVFDPPRAGAEAQCKALAKSNVKTIVAVSCNPNTFARDAALLTAGGYKLEQLWPIGQFLWSTHVELVAKFTK
jgi:23S rRNA (uracil1939-C5)-methyltransferase